MSRLLVVDDDPQVRGMLALTLRREGRRVLAAADGRQALAYRDEERLDLIISDILDLLTAVTELMESKD